MGTSTTDAVIAAGAAAAAAILEERAAAVGTNPPRHILRALIAEGYARGYQAALGEAPDGHTVLRVPLRTEDLALVEELLAEIAEFTAPGATSHGELSVELLATMLLEDCALAHRRPGSWEGANMLQVLSGHGYAP